MTMRIVCLAMRLMNGCDLQALRSVGVYGFIFSLFPILALGADVAPGSEGWAFEELGRFHAPEARQGVCADDEHLYVISNHDIGKYLKQNGERVATWGCEKGDPLTHINAGIIFQGKLYCAHSNYPGVPHVSSVEIWDPRTLKHMGVISFGRTDGSLTWFDRRNGNWLACLVHYAGRGGEAGRGPEWSRLVEFDDLWRPTGRGWIFPEELIRFLGKRGFGISGGAIGPDGLLFVTGHDEKALCVLQFPEYGSVLKWVATVPVTAEGQSFAWDPVKPDVVHMIIKEKRLVITGRVTRPEPTGKH